MYKFCASAQISLCCKPIQVSAENREHQRLATLRLTYVSSFDIVLIHTVQDIKRCFQQDISSDPFMLCRPLVCLLSSSSKIKTNKQKTGSSSKNNKRTQIRLSDDDNVAISGQWLDNTRCQESRHCFWLADGEFDCGRSSNRRKTNKKRPEFWKKWVSKGLLAALYRYHSNRKDIANTLKNVYCNSLIQMTKHCSSDRDNSVLIFFHWTRIVNHEKRFRTSIKAIL